MRISKPQIISEKNKSTYQVDVESAEGKETLWYTLHNSSGDLFTDASDAPLVALLVPAM